jgi:RNA polymerase sigma-70 factor (ECF subfamily)
MDFKRGVTVNVQTSEYCVRTDDGRSDGYGTGGQRFRRHADEAERHTVEGGRRFRSGHSADDVADRDPLVAEAVVEATRGSREALRFLYARYADNIYGYAFALLRNEHDAEDVTQQVFLKLMDNLGKYERRDVPFAAWIVRMARNAAIDKLREGRQVPCEEVFGPDEGFDDVVHECRESLRSALVQLPDDQRQVVVLRHLVGLSPGEIGKQLGKTEASIHGLHHRGRQAMRRELTKLDAAPALAASGSSRTDPSSAQRHAPAGA